MEVASCSEKKKEKRETFDFFFCVSKLIFDFFCIHFSRKLREQTNI